MLFVILMNERSVARNENSNLGIQELSQKWTFFVPFLRGTTTDPTISNTQDVEDAKQTSQMNFPRKFNNFTQELGNLV